MKVENIRRFLECLQHSWYSWWVNWIDNVYKVDFLPKTGVYMKIPGVICPNFVILYNRTMASKIKMLCSLILKSTRIYFHWGNDEVINGGTSYLYIQGGFDGTVRSNHTFALHLCLLMPLKFRITNNNFIKCLFTWRANRERNAND